MSAFDRDIWRRMNRISENWSVGNHIDSFIDEEDVEDFIDYVHNPSRVLMEMANVLGNNVKKEKKLPFSFYFSPKTAVRGAHGIRVKILWNPSKMGPDSDGYMELHGDYKYIRSPKRYRPSKDEENLAREFFKNIRYYLQLCGKMLFQTHLK